MISTRKKKPAALPAALGRLISLARGPGRPVVWVGLLGLVLVAAWYLAWRQVGPHVLASGQYLLAPQQVEITPPPNWIHTDIRAEVFRNASLDGPLSIMDDALTERIADAFSLHPWVETVRRVRKRHPARVEVELVYRRPVCMVEVPGGLFPVDARGVLLPSGDFSPIEATRYPRLVGVDTAPLGTVGECWGDARVVGGAEIAAVLGPAWDELRLARIVPSRADAADEYTYTLLSRGGTQIAWGRAPGDDSPGEPPANDKLARLRRYVAEHGTLEGRDAPQELDVRRLRVSSRPKR